MRPRSLIAVVALSTAAAMVIIHILAIFGVAPLGMAPIPIAFIVVFVCWGAFIQEQSAAQARSGGLWRRFSFEFASRWPLWARTTCGAVFLYAGVNFALFRHAVGGSVETIEGRRVLSDHGRIIRELEDADVAAIDVWHVRALSGHILIFLVLPGFHFLFNERPEVRREILLP